MGWVIFFLLLIGISGDDGPGILGWIIVFLLFKWLGWWALLLFIL